MPRDGSGNYQLPTGNPVIPNTIISSNGWANPTLTDIAAAITQSISRDGQTTPTANLPMGNFRHTQVAAAASRTDYARADQVQDSTFQWLAVTGTDTILGTISTPSGLAAYTAGQTFRFLSAGANTTSAVTLNINTIGAKAVTKFGTNTLQPGDIPSGAVVTVTYDGTQFQLQSTAGVTAGGPIGSSRNLVMYIPTASASATLSADEIIVQTQLGGLAYKLSNFNKTINLATIGVGGMDTGTAPVSSFVGIYGIFNPTSGTFALLAQSASSVNLPEVYGGSHMPIGYTASALLSVWPTNLNGQLVVGRQRDRRISNTANTQLSTTTVTNAWTSFSIGGTIPQNAKRIFGYGGVTQSSSGTVNLFVSGDSNGVGAQEISIGTAAGGNTNSSGSSFAIDIYTPSTAYYNSQYAGSGSVTYTLTSTGYEI